MDTENDKYWRNRVEKVEMELDHWKTLVYNYVYIRENGLNTQLLEAYNSMLAAVEQDMIFIPIDGVQDND